MQIKEITMIHSGPAPFCEWCGYPKTAGSEHGHIESTDANATVTKVKCIVVVYGELKGQISG